MSELIEHPNPFYSGELLWRMTMAEYFIYGNAYWLMVGSKVGSVAELWWVPQALMRPRWKENGNSYIDWYDYTPDPSRTDRVYKIPIENVVHIRHLLDPDNIRVGMSPLKPVLREIWTDDEAANFTAALLRNLGHPGIIISPGDEEIEFTDEDADAMKIQYQANFSNDKRGEPMIVSSPVKIEKLSLSPEEMSLTELRRIPEERISACLGVNPIVTGLGAGLQASTFRNYKEARGAAYDESLIPTQRMVAGELNRSMLPRFESAPTFRVRFDLSNVRALLDDQLQLLRRADMGVKTGWITVGAGMRMIGMSTAGQDYDYYLRGNNQNPVPLSEANKPKEEPKPIQIPVGGKPQALPAAASKNAETQGIADQVPEEVVQWIEEMTHATNGHTSGT
jgi:HK97 family phage portal protein